MAHVQLVDELVREYLARRGLAATVRSLDQELRADRDRGFRPDRIVEGVVAAVAGHDLAALRELWARLDSHTFSRLESHFAPAVRKIESGLLKYYLVTAAGAGRGDRVSEFFVKTSAELHGQSEWREWFALPYVARPEETPPFAAHFSRQWQEALLASLHNLLATAHRCAPQPTLSAFEEEARELKRLREENASLSARLARLEGGGSARERRPRPGRRADGLRPPPPLVDDFYAVPAGEAEAAVREARGLRGLIRQMGGSPVPGKKQTRSLSQT